MDDVALDREEAERLARLAKYEELEIEVGTVDLVVTDEGSGECYEEADLTVAEVYVDVGLFGGVVARCADCQHERGYLGDDCLIVVTDGHRTDIVPDGTPLGEEWAMSAVVCPCCGELVGRDQEMDSEYEVVRCPECDSLVTTGSIRIPWESDEPDDQEESSDV